MLHVPTKSHQMQDFSKKNIRKRLAAGLRQDQLGELKRSTRPAKKGEGGGKGKGREGRENGKGLGKGKGREGEEESEG